MQYFEVYQLFEELRTVNLDRLAPLMLEMCGEAGVEFVDALADLLSEEGLASVDLAFDFPHRNHSAEYNGHYTRLKALYSNLAPLEILANRAITVKTMADTFVVVKTIEEVAVNA